MFSVVALCSSFWNGGGNANVLDCNGIAAASLIVTFFFLLAFIFAWHKVLGIANERRVI